MKEIKSFEEDSGTFTTPKEKNDRLIDILSGRYNKREIVSIERIEIAAQGWRITYRTDD